MATKLNILVVEDNDLLRSSFVDFIRSSCHDVVDTYCAEDVADIMKAFMPDILVVDYKLPGESGMSLVARLRKSFPALGIIFVTANDQLKDKIEGYRSGADIYLTKPIDPSELFAAIEALGRRVGEATRTASVELNMLDEFLSGDQGRIKLAASEISLLKAFISSPEQKLERWQVASYFDLVDDDVNSRSMEVRLSILRKKLKVVSGDGNPIKPIRGYGYHLAMHIEVS